MTDHLAHAVTCPVCRAPADQPCARPRGQPHRARIDRATSILNQPRKARP